jgi:hypothetical protein
VAEQPDYVEARRGLEVVLRHLGRTEEADEQVESIERLEPER